MTGFYKIRETAANPLAIGVTTTTPTEIAAIPAGVDLIPANSARKALRIINETDKEMLIATGTLAATPATTTNKILILPPQTAWTFASHELPLQALNALWVGGTPAGKAVVVEGV